MKKLVVLLAFAITCSYSLVGAKNQTKNAIFSILLTATNQDSALKQIKKILNISQQLDLTNRAGDTALHLAIEKNYGKIVAFFIASNPGLINKQSSAGYTPLMIAIRHGFNRLAKQLLNKGADLSLTASDGSSAFLYAVKDDDIELVEEFVQRGCDINSTDKNGTNALMWALINRCKETSQYFLENNSIDVTAKDANDQTALHYAVFNASTQTLEAIIAKGANVDAQDILGLTPLHYACMQGDIKHIELLIARGAKIDQPDKYGFTPLALSCYNGHRSSALFLLKKGATLTPQIVFDQSLLGLAAQRNQCSIIKLLLKKKMAIDQRDQMGNSATMLAVLAGATGAVKILIQHTAKKDDKNKIGDTLLHGAVHNGQIEIFDFLINNGFGKYIYTQNIYGQTPLHLAVASGNFKLVQKILSLISFYDPSRTEHLNDKISSPLAMALRRGYSDIAELLINCGATCTKTLAKSPAQKPHSFLAFTAALLSAIEEKTPFEEFEKNCLQSYKNIVATKKMIGLDKQGTFTEKFNQWYKKISKTGKIITICYNKK